MKDSGAEGPVSYPLLGARSAAGGILMGLANLVPGISGGTMLLATGIYPRFIAAVAEVTTFRFRARSLFVLAVVGACAAAAILVLSGPVKGLVVEHRWVMYSLFIGLTLGGVPVVWRMARPPAPALWCGAAGGFAAMAVLAWLQTTGGGTTPASREGLAFLFFAGVAGSSAMILPGVSGGYLLLVLGVYVPILAAIDAVWEAMKAGNLEAAADPALSVVLPVGLGVVAGIAAVSNALKFLLGRFEKATLGVLLGLLVGAVVGLWPFQEGVRPRPGDLLRGQVVTPELLASLKPEKYPTEFFPPTAGQVAGALGLIAAGFALTAAVAHLGGRGGRGRTNRTEGPPRP